FLYLNCSHPGYACELCDRQLYPDWYRHERTAFTTQGNGSHERTEVLWSNRPLRRQLSITEASEFRDNEPSSTPGCHENRCAETSCATVVTQPSTGRPGTTAELRAVSAHAETVQTNLADRP
ncbi:hypothetical protein ACLMAL_36955, partial [Nocardia sp. CWNU-33]